MAESDKVFAGSIPKFYDTLMVPLIFEAYAVDLAELVAASSPGSVLETAAGSGVVTRALAPKLSADACYVVTDLNQPMLDYAATRQGSDSRIEWRQADALDLPFEDASFDVVCCQFGAMFFPNRVAGYAEARRVLRPGGRFVSVSGIASKRTPLPTTSPTPSPQCFRTTLRDSSLGRRTAITISH
jgi:ubiquinone/menaquinone biosynthesis C-methylase UbiE